MPIRTSSVVSGGMALLTLVGITTIFGNSIVAMVAPVGQDQPKAPSSLPVAAPVPDSGTGVDAG